MEFHYSASFFGDCWVWFGVGVRAGTSLCCPSSFHPSQDSGKQKELSWGWGEVLDPQKGSNRLGWGGGPSLSPERSRTKGSKSSTGTAPEKIQPEVREKGPWALLGARQGRFWDGAFLTLPGARSHPAS